MNLTDSHAHFDSFVKGGTVPELLERARSNGVRRVIAIGGSPEANERACDVARAYPALVRATAGFDRDLAAQPPPIEELFSVVQRSEVVAVGESGLDYHYAPETAPQQRSLFAAMLELARAAHRPIVIHSRDADDDTIELLRAHLGPEGGVLHCFTGTKEFAARLLDLGLYISFSGIVTFKKSDDLRAVAKMVPLDRLLIETDAPYLAPVPHRGKPNEPAWVLHVAETLASLRGIPLDEFAEQTSANAARLFECTEKIE